MKKQIAIAFIALMSFSLQAQDEGSSQYGVNYHLALPMGDFDNFMKGENSYRGFSFDYRYFLKDKFALGGTVGWQIYGEKFEKDTYVFDKGAATLVQWRYSHHVPILLTGHYTLTDSDRLRLTAGLGMGAAFVREEVWLGLYTLEWTQWGFQMAPEVALQIKINEKFGLLFAPRYNVVFNGERANFDDVKNHYQVWDFRFGLYFNN